MHDSVIQRANEAIKLLRYPSVVTALLCRDQDHNLDAKTIVNGTAETRIRYM
jgi:hypothetical protein